MMSTVSPPPADLVLRLAMFRSWDIPVSRGLAGVLMNTLTFYVIRFSAPVLGLLLVLVTAVPYVDGYAWVAGAGAAVAISCSAWCSGPCCAGRAPQCGSVSRPAALGAVAEVGRPGELGRLSGRVPLSRGHALPPRRTPLLGGAHPDGGRGRPAARHVPPFRRHPGGALSTLAIMAVFLTFYPFTLFPLAGLGVLDALVVAALVDTGGLDLEPELVAGLIVYRVDHPGRADCSSASARWPGGGAPKERECRCHAMRTTRSRRTTRVRRPDARPRGRRPAVPVEVSTGHLPEREPHPGAARAGAPQLRRRGGRRASPTTSRPWPQASPDLFGIAIGGCAGGSSRSGTAPTASPSRASSSRSSSRSSATRSGTARRGSGWA